MVSEFLNLLLLWILLHQNHQFMILNYPEKENTLQLTTDELKEEAYIRIIDTPGFN